MRDKIIIGSVLCFIISLRLFFFIPRLSFHGDEISWFFHTKFFEQAFITRDFNRTFWTSYESFDHPQLSKYIFGGYVFLQDRNIFAKRDLLEKKWGRWDFYFNPRLGDIKKSEFAPYIEKMREVNVGFTLGTFILLYACILLLTGNIYISLIIPLTLSFNQLFVSSMIRATSDAHMVFFVLLALVLMNTGFVRKKLLGTILLGITIGCAVSTKLTGAIILIIYGLDEYISGFFRQTKIINIVKRVLVVIIVVGIIWYVSNPGLYGNILTGTREYIVFRNRVSVQLEWYFPDVALVDSWSRIRATFCTLVNPVCATHPGALTPNVYINASVVFMGFIGLFIKMLRKEKTALTTLLFIVGTLTVNTVYLPLDSDRYYLLPVLSVYLIYAFGFELLWKLFVALRKQTTKNPT